MSWRKLKIALTSLAALSVVAFLYDSLFVRVQKRDDAPTVYVNPNSDDAQTDVFANRLPELLTLFPDPNDWRRTSANVVVPKGKECIFLSKGSPSISQDQKSVSLNACTFVFLGPIKQGVSEEERVENAFVFESTDKLELTFSEPLNKLAKLGGAVGGFDMSKFKSGRMLGEVLIRAKLGDSKVSFRTRDVVFDTKQIHSNFEVAFQLGPNSGTGRGLTIDMETPLRFSSRDRRSSVNDVNEDELSTEDRLDQLVSEGNIGGGFSIKGVLLDQLDGCVKFYSDSLSGMQAKGKKETNVDDNQGHSSYYVEARCKSGLYFSSNSNVPGGWCVRFNKDVEMVGFKDGAKSTQIKCDALYLYLQDPVLDALTEEDPSAREMIARKRITGSLGRLVPTMVRAIRGENEQVVAREFNANVKLCADEVQYDLLGRRINLAANDEQPVEILQNGERNALTFNSKIVQIQLNENADVESISASQNGRLVATVVNELDEERTYVATWERALRAAPPAERPGYLQLTSSGGVEFHSDELGSFFANEADFWCRLANVDENNENVAVVDSNATPSFSVDSLVDARPVLADFRGSVSFNSQRAKAKIDDSVVVRFESQDVPEGAVFERPKNNANLFGDRNDSNADAMFEPPKSTFELGGGKLEVCCLLRYAPDNPTPDLEVKRLILRGNVAFSERDGASGYEKMRLNADAVQIDDPSSERAKLRLLGNGEKLATFLTEKLSLTGSDVAIDSEQNYFQVIGAGALQLVSPVTDGTSQNDDENNQFGRFLTSDPIKVRWSNAMEFDGRKLVFKSLASKNVVVSQGPQRLLSPEVSLTLKNPLSIFKLNVNDKDSLDVEAIECAGTELQPVDIEVYAPSNDEADPREARYSALLQNLKFNCMTGQFAATGGGEIRGLVPSSGDSVDSLSSALPGVGQKKSEEVAKDVSDDVPKNWTKLHAKFQGDVVGEISAQEATLTNGIRAVIAVVSDPDTLLDADDPNSCPKDCASIESQNAFIRLVRNGNNGKTNMEIEATQNVLFKQKDVAGLCAALRYASQKNLVVLSGSPSNKASLYRQAYQGAEREQLAEFSRATYQLDTGKFSVESLSHSN